MTLLRRLAVLCLALCCSATVVAADRMTEADVKAVVTGMESAASRNDLAAVSTFLSDNAVVRMTSPNPGGGTSIRSRSKSDYLAREAAAQKQFPDSRFESTTPTITLAADGVKATATYSGTQRFTSDQQQVVATVDQVATVELRDGKPIVTAIDSTMTGMTVDGRKVF